MRGRNGKKTGFPGQGLVTESRIVLDMPLVTHIERTIGIPEHIESPEYMNEAKILHFIKSRGM